MKFSRNCYVLLGLAAISLPIVSTQSPAFSSPLFASTSLQVAQVSNQNRLLDLTTRIVNNLVETDYTHRPLRGTQNEPDVFQTAMGSYKAFTDCSGFVSYVIKHSNPRAYRAVEQFQMRFSTDEKWPLAYVYQHYFEALQTGRISSGIWSAVPELRRAMPGDVLAWCLDQRCLGQSHRSNEDTADDTGHVMVVASRPEPIMGEQLQQLKQRMRQDSFALPETAREYYQVKVFDSSGARHYDDSRWVGGQKTSGVGSGVLYFAVNEMGRPIAFEFHNGPFKFSGIDRRTQKHQTINISIGRIN